MRISMSFQARRELLVQVAPRYKEADRKEKSLILNEFMSSTGYSRKYAIRMLSQREIGPVWEIRRPRQRYYGAEVQAALHVAWAAANFIASKRLAPFLEELVPRLEFHGYLTLSDDVRSQLLRVSPATIDRILGPTRAEGQPHGVSTTKSGILLKHQIPVRTFADWEEKKPGFFEADLVAHCGTSTAGAFLNTLVLTDIATGWVECFALLHKSQHGVIQAIDRARQLLPFKILGIDTDNGSEFINAELLNYCKREKITFTRGRAYKKNDQCYVEQKNGVIVRQLVGYDRFEGVQACRQLSHLYRAIRLYINFFQPSMKLQNKVREGGKVRRTYDTAQTPFQRLLLSTAQEKAGQAEHVYKALDPVRLLSQIKVLQDALWRHAVVQPVIEPNSRPEIRTCPELSFQVNECGQTEEKSIDGLGGDLFFNTKKMNKRRYRKSKKPRAPHWWRTRKDPFEAVWDEICLWLEKNPEQTAKALLQKLQQCYPDQYSDNQLRTLQRRVKIWRAKTILIFDDEWLQEDTLASGTLPLQLKAEMQSDDITETLSVII